VETVSIDLAGNQIRWRTRDLLLDGASNERVAPMFVVDGRDHLDGALAEGRGVIMLTGHYGAHLLPSHWLLRKNYPLRFYMERPRHVSQFLTRQFQSEGPLGQDKLFISRKGETAESASSILRASRVLRAGMIVYLAGDVRWAGQHTAAGRFLGRTYSFSTTWVSLAAMTAAPVVPVFCQMEPSGLYHIEFQPPFRVPDHVPRSGQMGHWVQSYLQLLEDQVRKYPANSNEYFFWPESDEIAA
jgi:KDO2-lipid IV(A) lauroyltransferase